MVTSNDHQIGGNYGHLCKSLPPELVLKEECNWEYSSTYHFDSLKNVGVSGVANNHRLPGRIILRLLGRAVDERESWSVV